MSLDREGATQAVGAWRLFGIPKRLKCVERREAGRELDSMHPKPGSHSGRNVGKPDEMIGPSLSGGQVANSLP
jgi:hypothetical protein